MSYRPYAPPAPLLIGYDPVCDLPPDHLARLVEAVVEEAITVPLRPHGPGNSPFDPRLPIKVLVYGYATGVRSSRRLEQSCSESLPYLFLTRGDTPSYRTLCRTRVEESELIEQVWVSLFAVAGRCGLQRLGKIVVDSSKLRADASPEAVLTPDEYGAVRAELERILAEAAQVDAQEEREGGGKTTRVGATVEREQMRAIVRRVRQQLGRAKRAEAAAKQTAAKKEGAPGEKAAAAPPAAGAPNEEPAAPTAPAAADEAAGAPAVGAGVLEAAPVPPVPAPVPAVGGVAAVAGAGEAARPREAPLAPPSPATVAGAVAGDGIPAAAAAPSAAPPPSGSGLTRRMRQRVAAALVALDTALAEERKHLCLTDPDARMMGEGRSRRVQECYSFEVAVDRGAGLLVAAGVTQDPSDNARLEPLVAQAQAHEPEGVKAADADSGYFSGGALGRLIRAGVDTCVPDCNTAGDLHRGQPAGTIRAQGRGSVVFEYDPAADCYRCPEGNELRREQTRHEAGQKLTEYRAQRSCAGCPLARQCLTQKGAQHRMLKVSEYEPELTAARERFNEPEHRERYRHRGEVVETVFGFVRGTLGYVRWLLRGVERVECEARLIKVGYQLRKVQAHGTGT
jgi:transposase